MKEYIENEIAQLEIIEKDLNKLECIYWNEGNRVASRNIFDLKEKIIKIIHNLKVSKWT